MDNTYSLVTRANRKLDEVLERLDVITERLDELDQRLIDTRPPLEDELGIEGEW